MCSESIAVLLLAQQNILWFSEIDKDNQREFCVLKKKKVFGMGVVSLEVKNSLTSSDNLVGAATIFQRRVGGRVVTPEISTL